MARQHGRNARLYMAITSGGTAEPVAFLRQWSISFTTDNVEVTAFGDTNKVYVAGLPDSSGSYSGFYDDATAQFYTAAQDGVARRFYLYPSTASSTQYFFGTGLFDFSLETTVDGANTISGDFQAASIVSKVG
jgi:predicted secreted protein